MRLCRLGWRGGFIVQLRPIAEPWGGGYCHQAKDPVVGTDGQPPVASPAEYPNRVLGRWSAVLSMGILVPLIPLIPPQIWDLAEEWCEQHLAAAEVAAEK